MDRDEEQLRLLSIFHYVVAGLAALFSFFPIFHLIMRESVWERFEGARKDEPPTPDHPDSPEALS